MTTSPIDSTVAGLARPWIFVEQRGILGVVLDRTGDKISRVAVWKAGMGTP